MTPLSHSTFAAFIGIDWAEAKHEGGLPAAGTAKRACLQLEHTPETMDAWGTTRRTRCHGQPVAVDRALAKGPLVSALRTYDWLVLCPIQPLTLARYRAAFPPRRAKDAPPEAALQLARLLTHRAKLPPLTPQRASWRALPHLVAHRRRVGGAQGRLPHRLPRTLKP